ncbi:hypothetical protein BSKO_11838 [Bryopsis sp. KO-2023]|nr:hypothetical protein BSKO_11838 [Bryopsis sp. KO-2023]
MGSTSATRVLVFVVASVMRLGFAGCQRELGDCRGSFACTFSSTSFDFDELIRSQTASAERLTTALLSGNIRDATQVMTGESSWKALSDGFKNSKRQKSFNRNTDPDVIAFKAIANAAMKGTDLVKTKLAEAIVDSIIPRGGLPFGYTRSGLTSAFLRDIRDRSLMTRISFADANRDSVRRRKLLCSGCTPSSSSVCSFCWPESACQSAFWC